MILGIDEVGRGPWAGPLVVGAVILNGQIEGLTDSKILSKKRREELAREIHATATVGLGWVHADEIDKMGLGRALALACRRAVEQVDSTGVAYQEIIIDGTINLLKDTQKGRFVTTMKKADLLIASVSAASIVAKVARDQFMAEQDALYPEYDFASHVGYGTAAHRAAIAKHGVTPLHRLSFAPLAKYASTQHKTACGSHPLAGGATGVTTKQIGDRAEDVATEYLVREGHEIVERNWKTKFCEIDIVSRKGDTVYFTEVKHRKNARAGGGIAAITPKKLKQMTFAARVYAKSQHLEGISLRLAVATTSGDPTELESYMLVD